MSSKPSFVAKQCWFRVHEGCLGAVLFPSRKEKAHRSSYKQLTGHLIGSVTVRSGQEVCFGPSRPDPGRNARDQDGTRTGRDGPHLGTWMGPKHCKTKHMANLDGTTWTRDGTWTGPGSDPGEGLDGTPRDSNRLLGLSDTGLSKPLITETGAGKEFLKSAGTNAGNDCWKQFSGPAPRTRALLPGSAGPGTASSTFQKCFASIFADFLANGFPCLFPRKKKQGLEGQRKLTFKFADKFDIFAGNLPERNRHTNLARNLRQFCVAPFRQTPP